MIFQYMKCRVIRGTIRVITALIPVKRWRKAVRRSWLNRYSRASFPYYDSVYTIYPPYYSSDELIDGAEPDIYNKHGERVRTYFFRDYYLLMHATMSSRYFLFERYNIGMDTHFYGHTSMLELMGKPKRRYGYLFESRGAIPEDFQLFSRHPDLHKDFDHIFTHDYDILSKYDNARFWPSCASSWIPEELSDPGLIDRKTLKASIVSSHKSSCEMHIIRTAAANYLKANHGRLGVDTFGSFDGGPLIPIHQSLLDYRYSFAVENYISPYFFTERLINCFLTCTVPVYVGATDIGKFFNTDGIIQISPKELRDLDKIVGQCTESDYQGRREAILDNFQRAQEFKNPWDYMYLKYLQQ